MHKVDHLTTAQVADLLGLTPSTINRMVARRELEPAFKLPGRTGAHIFAAKDIKAFAAASRHALKDEVDRCQA